MKIGFQSMLLALAFTLLAWSVARLPLELGSVSWPTVEGVVAEVRADPLKPLAGTNYHAVIEYEYEVDGQRFAGQVVSWEETGYLDWREAPATGSKVKVHHHPREHDLAVLLPGVTQKTKILVIVGLAVLGLSLYVAAQGGGQEPSVTPS